mmetsp:Transcript_579/g.742  ORF Transcript_579/g.742 Transcript_579/m.742 type:complete len:206 (-) Transcript_579:216-833(-)
MHFAFSYGHRFLFSEIFAKKARVIRIDRKKIASYKQREIEQIRVSYAEKERRFILDGDREELDRIKDELSLLENNSHQVPKWHPKNENPPNTKGISCEPSFMDSGTDLRRGPPPSPMAAPRYPSNYQEVFHSPTSVLTIGAPDAHNGEMTDFHSQKQNTSPLEPYESEVKRLQKERNDLISTGLCGADHPIVVKLDRLLQEADVH